MSSTSKPSAADRDAQVLDSIKRLGLGVRELLRVALGIDPNNILQRLLGRGLVRSVQGLPQSRAYYVDSATQALGSQALHQRLALAWHVLMNPGPPCAALTSAELTELFGLPAPSGAHVLEAGAKPRVLHVYAPEGIEVASGIVRHVKRAQSTPAVAKAVRSGEYGFLVLLPWNSMLVEPLRAALTTREIAGIESGFVAQAKKLRGIAAEARFVVERVATPETLTLALTGGAA